MPQIHEAPNLSPSQSYKNIYFLFNTIKFTLFVRWLTSFYFIFISRAAIQRTDARKTIRTRNQEPANLKYRYIIA